MRNLRTKKLKLRSWKWGAALREDPGDPQPEEDPIHRTVQDVEQRVPKHFEAELLEVQLMLINTAISVHIIN